MLRRTYIKKYSEKGLIRKEEKKQEKILQNALFERHWNSKPHYCESCDKWLGEENKTIFHDHLLEKSKWKELALEIDNLFLCCLDCHASKTNGFPTVKHQIAILAAEEKFKDE